jgi:mono/diheme cytochrome c family protein
LKHIVALTGFVGLATVIGLWILSAPRPIDAAVLPAHKANPANGEQVFHVAGCSSCHAAPSAKGDDKLKLSGGRKFDTQFGAFRAPNISPHQEAGIGGWTTIAFVNAVMRGISPGGQHYYPAFPYSSYARMTRPDVIDLKAYMDTLPAVASDVPEHNLAFPFNIRRGLGLWKLLYLNDGPRVPLAEPSADARRGQYLVEGPGHCGECHTSRNAIGGLRRNTWLAGGPNPEGKGVIPNITPHADGLAAWSADDIAFYLETGLSPDFEVVGGAMVAVQENIARLPADDRTAIAAYLKAVPARPNGYVKTDAAK